MSTYRDKSNFYGNLAILLDSGIGLHDALTQPHHGRFKRVSQRLAQRIDQGQLLYEAVSCEKIFTHFECSLIKVGGYSGHLPKIFRSLSEWFDTQQKIKSSVLSAFLYPMFVYHFAGLIFAVVSYVSKSAQQSQIIPNMAAWFLFPWLVLLLCRILLKLLPGFLLNALPVIGDLIFKLETTFYFKILGLALDSGIGAVNSLVLAAGCCRNSSYRKRYLKVAEMVEKKSCSISDAFNKHINSRERYSAIPTLLASAEMSGTLPNACENISKMQQDAAILKMTMLAKAAPVIIYLPICAYIAYRIILFYKDYFNQIQSLL